MWKVQVVVKIVSHKSAIYVEEDAKSEDLKDRVHAVGSKEEESVLAISGCQLLRRVFMVEQGKHIWHKSLHT